jgi:hypothetical protein
MTPTPEGWARTLLFKKSGNRNVATCAALAAFSALFLEEIGSPAEDALKLSYSYQEQNMLIVGCGPIRAFNPSQP